MQLWKVVRNFTTAYTEDLHMEKKKHTAAVHVLILHTTYQSKNEVFCFIFVLLFYFCFILCFCSKKIGAAGGGGRYWNFGIKAGCRSFCPWVTRKTFFSVLFLPIEKPPKCPPQWEAWTGDLQVIVPGSKPQDKKKKKNRNDSIDL